LEAALPNKAAIIVISCWLAAIPYLDRQVLLLLLCLLHWRPYKLAMLLGSNLSQRKGRFSGGKLTKMHSRVCLWHAKYACDTYLQVFWLF